MTPADPQRKWPTTTRSPTQEPMDHKPSLNYLNGMRDHHQTDTHHTGSIGRTSH